MTFPSVRLGARVQRITPPKALECLSYNHSNCISIWASLSVKLVTEPLLWLSIHFQAFCLAWIHFIIIIIIL